ncbi:hypothetical protein [Bacillus sp. B15-48]|nr:hypothetical protein [Bacillus sp. B15-48]MBM4764785.1 hypothetical protein [Bacillus sp. B15-48]
MSNEKYLYHLKKVPVPIVLEVLMDLGIGTLLSMERYYKRQLEETRKKEH